MPSLGSRWLVWAPAGIAECSKRLRGSQGRRPIDLRGPREIRAGSRHRAIARVPGWIS